MDRPLTPRANAGAPLVRARTGENCFPGFPSRLNHVLVLSDLTPASEPALEFAFELAGRFLAQVRLMHAGNAEPPRATSGSDERDRIRLMCLFWHARRCHPDASVCLELNRRPEQILASAAERQTDLIILPEPVLRRFARLVIREGARERLQGSPCLAVAVKGPFSGPIPQARYGVPSTR